MNPKSTDSSFETALSRIALDVANRYVKDGQIVGLGSGSTVARFAKALGERVKRDSLSITVIPSSMQAWLLAKENHLSAFSDNAHCPKSLDVAVDGADQICVGSRSMIKGGGGALLKEKIILSSSEQSFILGDASKFVEALNRSVPIEVVQFAVLSVEKKIRDLFGGEPILRKLDKGYPFFTESSNVILDCQFKDAIRNPLSMESELKQLPGVVEVGIFNCKIAAFYKANHDGSFGEI